MYWSCVSYSRVILFWAIPPCPNGQQCYCEEYDRIQEEWEQEQPNNYKEWNEAELQSIELAKTDAGSQKCPLCRKNMKEYNILKSAF